MAPAACVYLDDLGINCKPAAALGMRAIKVTGEDQALADALREIGCQFGQGFLYARALPPEQFEQMLSGIEGMVG